MLQNPSPGGGTPGTRKRRRRAGGDKVALKLLYHPLMKKNDVFIAAIGTANPPCKFSQEEAAALVEKHYGAILKERSIDLLLQALRHPSIATRYFAIDRPAAITVLKDEDPDKRNDRFTRWAVELAVSAARKALSSAKVAPQEVSALVVNTCTGYVCPGIATYCLEPLTMRPDTLALDLVGGGCGAALPNVMLAEALLERNGAGPVVSIAVEICTATFQMGDDPSLLISNAIFGDGAAAAILWKEPRGLRLRASASRFLPQNRDDVRYVYKSGQLHNRITSRLPDVICRSVPVFIRDFLEKQGRSIASIDAWALHPGGDKMVNGLKKELSLSEEQMAGTRSVLREYGNMSSPTVLFIIDRVMRERQSGGDSCLAVAYGAGMSLHACLLERAG
jgi:predicted naringenin-chalcone synthase